MRTRFPLAVVFASLIQAVYAAELPADDDSFVGPPLITRVGCDARETWDAKYVAKVIGVTDRIIRRMNKRFTYSPALICFGEPKEVARLAKEAERSGEDDPEGAYRFRVLSLTDESGKVRPEGLLQALQQRDQIVADTALRNAMSDAGITSASWTGLGPFNVGGRVRAIAVNPTNTSRVIVGSVSGGIWKSTDGGATYTAVNDFLPSVAVTCMVHDPVTPSTMYACTGEGASGDSIRGLGIYKSTNSGDSWAQMPSTNPSAAPSAANGNDPGAFYIVNRLAIHPTNSLIMLAATSDGIFRTTDGGANWTWVYGSDNSSCGGRRVYDVRFDPANGSFAVFGEAGYFDCTVSASRGGAAGYSIDGGATWTRVPLAGTNRVEIAPAPSTVSGGRTQTWYASVNASNGQIWKSADGGQTWSMVSSLGHLSQQGDYDNTIWVAPNDANRLLVGGVNMFFSTDGGVDMQVVCNAHVDHHALVADPNYASTGIVYNGNDGGVYRRSGLLTATMTATGLNTSTCASGITTANLNNTLAITQFYGGAGATAPSQRLAGGTQDNGSFVYNYSTSTWTTVFGGDGGEGAVDNTDTNYSYGETQYMGIHRQTAGGSVAGSSSAICAGISDADCLFGANPSPTTNFIAPLMLDPSNPNTLYAGGASLWRSTNVKAATPTWTAVKPALGAFNYISYIAVAPSNSDIVWVGYNSGALYRSTNATTGSPTWTQIGSPAGRMVMRILIDKDDPSRVYVSFGGYSSPNIYLATDALTNNPTWVSKHGSLPASPIRSIARHPNDALWLYVGTEVGLFTTMDGGLTWSATNDGPGTVSVEELFFLTPTTLIASTHGRGMFQATVSAPPTSAGTIQLATTAASVAESAGSVSITVTRLGGSNGAASVQYTTGTTGSGAGFATPNVDFTTTSGTLNWASGDSTARTVTIPIINDSLVEGNETFSLSLSNATGATMGTPTNAVVTIIDPDAFPVNCVMPAGWTVPGTANAGWAVATDQKFEGVCSLKSQPITDGQKAQIQYQGTFLAGNVTFRRKVSSEQDWDFFRFYIDGVAQQNCSTGVAGCSGASVTGAAASGETDWTQPAGILTYPVSAGVHTVTFSFEKDPECCLGGADAAWIDAVSLPLPVAEHHFDFNADGKPDIIWSNTANGNTYVWYMNGPALITDAFIAGIDPSWKIQGIADFDGDGHPDLVWRNTATGDCYVWYMNGSTFIVDAFLFSLPPQWVIQGVADFNGDGKPDFLMRNTDPASGVGFAWFFNNATPVSSQFLFGIDPTWKVEQVGDMNGDGQPDLLFRNMTSGLAFAWYTAYSGGNLSLAGSSPSLFSIDPVWEIVQLADWNADGQPDLLFRNRTTGVVFIWYMSSPTALGGSNFIIQIDPSWEIVPRH